MSDLCNLQVLINGQHTFFISEIILSKYSVKLRKMIKQEKKRIQIRNLGIEIDNFPGGPDGFELVSRFCYNNGNIPITVDNVSLLHCGAMFLGMTEKASQFNLLNQTEVFLEGIFYWSWSEILTCLKNCELFFAYADSIGLIEKLLCSLLAKIAQNSDVNFLSVSSSSSSSSPETSRSCNSSSSRNKASWAWWFQDLTILSPKIIEQFLKSLGAYGSNNSNLVLTRFLLHYLKTTTPRIKKSNLSSNEYVGLVNTAVHGVVLIGKAAFSCRGLFWVLRIVSGFGLSRECRSSLERLIGGMLDQATLDDLLVSGGGGNIGEAVYDVNLVLRLIRLFVHYHEELSMDQLKKVGELVDVYLREIGPDPNLKVSKFLGVAESLPDCARDSFDHVYRAIDIYLQSHPSLSLEERSRLCRCINYEKLSLETCKDLAKNPRIPPRIAVQALRSQHSNIQTDDTEDYYSPSPCSTNKNEDYQLVLYDNSTDDTKNSNVEGEDMKVNLERMQGRVMELEKVCREMRGQMAKMVMIGPQQSSSRAFPKLC